MTAAVDLLDRTAELVDIASVSHDERAIADYVESALRGTAELEVTRIGDNVVARTRGGRGRRLLLGGHLDTVPPSGNVGARRDDGVVFGVGSADMKGGLAVLLALAPDLVSAAGETTLVFYAREEVARQHSGLLEIESSAPDLLKCDVAVLLEPTASLVEAGCQGVLRARLHLGGRVAHSARPWTGVNAIHRAGKVLVRLDAETGRRPVLDGCEYRESLQVVSITGGRAANVLPDAVELTLSHRFAPDRDVEEASSAIEVLLGDLLDPQLGDQLEILESAPPAPPALTDPLLARLAQLSGKPPTAKLAWTDVAYFAERAIPATNFGPGDPLLAHRADEQVTARALDQCYSTLAALVAGAD